MPPSAKMADIRYIIKQRNSTIQEVQTQLSAAQQYGQYSRQQRLEVTSTAFITSASRGNVVAPSDSHHVCYIPTQQHLYMAGQKPSCDLA